MTTNNLYTTFVVHSCGCVLAKFVGTLDECEAVVAEYKKHPNRPGHSSDALISTIGDFGDYCYDLGVESERNHDI